MKKVIPGREIECDRKENTSVRVPFEPRPGQQGVGQSGGTAFYQEGTARAKAREPEEASVAGVGGGQSRGGGESRKGGRNGGQDPGWSSWSEGPCKVWILF